MSRASLLGSVELKRVERVRVVESGRIALGWLGRVEWNEFVFYPFIRLIQTFVANQDFPRKTNLSSQNVIFRKGFWETELSATRICESCSQHRLPILRPFSLRERRKHVNAHYIVCLST